MRHPRNLRILEIGNRTLFNRVHPDITTQIWTGSDTRDAIADRYRKPLRSLWSLWRSLRQNRFDLIVCYPPEGLIRGDGWIRNFRRWIYSLPLALLRTGHRIPLVVLDLSDFPTIPQRNRFLIRQCRYYFKRELQLDRYARSHGSWAGRELLPKLKTISIGISAARMHQAPTDYVPKVVDVFFAGTIYPGVRSDGIRQLRALQQQGYIIDLPPDPLPLAEYLRRCSQAWLVWSPEGRGWDCFRHYEAAVAGSIPVMNRAPIHPYQPLRHGVECFYYDVEGDDLTTVLVEALRHRERLLSMAMAARDHVRQYFTHERLCAYILNTCGYVAAEHDEDVHRNGASEWVVPE